MTVTAIRKVLINYLEDADDKKVKAIYTLLEKDIENDNFKLTDEQLAILDEERTNYLSGEIKPYSLSEAMSVIKGI